MTARLSPSEKGAEIADDSRLIAMFAVRSHSDSFVQFWMDRRVLPIFRNYRRWRNGIQFCNGVLWHRNGGGIPLMHLGSSCVVFFGFCQRLTIQFGYRCRMIALQKTARTRRLADARSKQVLNCGSGPKSIRKLDAIFDPAAWREIRIDLDPGVRPDFVGSMTDMRHFRARTFDGIWSSHSLEHLHTHEIPHALAEVPAHSQDDGFALISCPDLQTVMTLFLEHGPDFVVYQSGVGPITLSTMFGHTRSIASGNLHMAHHSGLTAELLGGLLLQAGFAEAVTKRQNFDLCALALTEDADRDGILGSLQSAGLDMSSRPE